ISIGRPVLEVTLSPVLGDLATDSIKDSALCLRVPVHGISRFKLLSYASLFHVSLDTSAAIPKKLDSKIHVCFQRDDLLGLCQCQKDKWSSVQKGTWSAAMSPFENRYLDMRFNGQMSASVTISLVEDIQERFLVCLALGYVLLLFGAIISSWVLCCCSHSKAIAIGVFLVSISLLFQLGAESFPSHQLPVIVNYILQTFGFGEEMHHKVIISLLLGIICSGAALGYWIFRRLVISREDGTVDAGVADFVKWAMHIMGIIFIFQSTEDLPLALGVLISCGAFHYIRKWLRAWHEGSVNGNARDQWNRGTDGSGDFMGASMYIEHVYFSSFHNNRRKFTENERVQSTRKFTYQALEELAESPAFRAWLIVNAGRIRVDPPEPAKNVNKLRALKELSSMAMAYLGRVINLSTSKINILIGRIKDRAIWSGSLTVDEPDGG
ncbi:hypothetical protein PIB30_078601, partial [Stylosanthes scabra]|nr:hypothetical protein [Stylosanthes scabra]